jgi:hypothetical protein
MRFYPREDVAIQSELVESIRKNGRTALSVGVTSTNYRTETVHGKSVRIVHQADLHEISFVAQGACKEAYCLLIEKGKCGRSLSHDVQSKRVLADGGYAGVMRALRRPEARYN